MEFPVVSDSEQIGFVDCRYDGQDSFVHISEIDTELIHDADNTDLKPERVASEESAVSMPDLIHQLSGRSFEPEKGRLTGNVLYQTINF